jgi:hypoxanthine phosphoribosyltransferase
VEETIEQILIDGERIKSRVGELAEEILYDFFDKEIHIVGVLKGSFIFLADLIRAMHKNQKNIRIDFITVSSYGDGTVFSGEVKFEREFKVDIKGKSILLVDDIMDTGNTLFNVKRKLIEMGAEMVKTCVLLNKPARRQIPDFSPDYHGFTIEDEFVVGYGLDYAGYHREKPYIAVLKF